MEMIFWRAVLALCVMCVLAGAPMAYFGFTNGKHFSEQWVSSSDENRAELEECRAAGGSSEADQACLDVYTAKSSADLYLLEASNKAQSSGAMGLFLLVTVPLVSLIAFYLIRWILTGRLRPLWPTRDKLAKVG